MPNFELKIPPALLVVIFAIGMRLAAFVAPGLALPIPAAIAISILLVLTGFAFGLASVLSFRAARTTLNPTKPESSTSLVTSGIFRLSRNPIYLGMLLILLGWTIFLSNLVAVLFLPAFVLYMNRFQIRPEETFLTSRFGAKFAAYQSRVRRWL